MAIVPPYGPEQYKQAEERCHRHEVYAKLRAKYGRQVRPICNCRKRSEQLTEQCRFALPAVPDGGTPVTRKARRILVVAKALGDMVLDEETIDRWAQVSTLLDSYLGPIRDDLVDLPMILEDTRPSLAGRCKKAFDKLHETEKSYTPTPASRGFAYLPPPKDLLRDWAVSETNERPLDEFRQWRRMQMAQRKARGNLREALEIARLTNTFPVDVVRVMHEVVDVLEPVLRIARETSHTKTRAQGRRQTTTGLPASRLLAYQSLSYALAMNRDLLRADQGIIYKWLGDSRDQVDTEHPYHGTKMPKEETWKKYLRDACAYFHTDTNRVRDKLDKEWCYADKCGRSVVNVNEIMYRSSQQPD